MFAVSQGHYMAAYTHLFACMQCTNIDMWQPGGTHLHTIHLQGPQHVICLFAHLLHPKAVTWDCFGIHSCFNTCCLLESANGSQSLLFSGSLCTRDKTWQPEHQFKNSTLSQHHYMVTCLHAFHVPRSPYGSLSMLVHIPSY